MKDVRRCEFDGPCLECPYPDCVDVGRETGRVRKCAVCGREFVIRNWNQKYCSVECRAKGGSLYPEEARECAFCGREFTTRRRNQKYCSPGCRYEATKARKPQ